MKPKKQIHHAAARGQAIETENIKATEPKKTKLYGKHITWSASKCALQVLASCRKDL